MSWIGPPDSIPWLGRRALFVDGHPHHVVHRGNLRAQVFFSDDDRRSYLEMLAQCAPRFGAEIWAYCLMGNPVHLIAAAQHKDVPGRPFPGQWTGNWQAFLNQELTTQEIAWIRQNLATGRPTASREFVKQLEQETGKLMTPEPRGRKPATLANVIDLTEDMFR